MESSKLYVVGSVFITVLKITKCKNSKRKRMAVSFCLFFVLEKPFTGILKLQFLRLLYFFVSLQVQLNKVCV
ncbi:hypothetical protein DXC20_05650 [Bacteroides sp. OM08-17BH]|nr:hypothetical protein DXC20_05650 [Bacteroides sp. OM08-17BH]